MGGMPEAVQSFAENKDFNEVRDIQKRILAAEVSVRTSMTDFKKEERLVNLPLYAIEGIRM